MYKRVFFFFQAEDGIRDGRVTGVQTCALPISPLLAHLEANGQIVLRYEDNPNGSIGGIAAVTNEARNVLGLMPHPEHAVDPLLGSADGALILGSLVDAARERVPTPA